MKYAFLALTIANAVLAVVGLLFARPTQLFIGSNLLLVSYAFVRIVQYGQPGSQGFLPSFVFSEDNIATALAVLAISTAIFASTTIVVRSPTRGLREHWPPVPRWLLVLASAAIVYRIVSTRTVFEAAYMDRAVYGTDLAGLGIFLTCFLLYAGGVRVNRGRSSPAIAVAAIFALTLVTEFSRGSTGAPVGMVLTAGVCYYGISRPRATWQIGFLLLMMLALVPIVRAVRNNYVTQGVSAASRAARELASSGTEESVARTGESGESNYNAAQYASHLLECVTLYERDVSRNWRSILNPFVFTVMPSFLVAPLGLERPLDAPGELLTYFIHGGGIFVPGELYWNGGFLCLIPIWTLLCVASALCDRNYRTSWRWFAFATQYASTLLMGIGYGYAFVFRGAANGLLAVLVLDLTRKAVGLRRATIRPSIASPTGGAAIPVAHAAP